MRSKLRARVLDDQLSTGQALADFNGPLPLAPRVAAAPLRFARTAERVAPRALVKARRAADLEHGWKPAIEDLRRLIRGTEL